MTTVTSLPITLDARGTKGLLLAATADKWEVASTTNGVPLFRMPSQTQAGVSYLVNTQGCTCPDFQRTPTRACKHVVAVQINRFLVDALASGEIQ